MRRRGQVEERVDVREAMRRRAEGLIEGDPFLTIHFKLYSGDYGDVGLVTIMTPDERIFGVEYFESEGSWMRPSAFDEYKSAADQGWAVTVIIPHDYWTGFNERMKSEGVQGIEVYDYISFGLQPWLLA